MQESASYSPLALTSARSVNSLWSAQAGGTSTQLLISDAGTYSLTEDLTTQAPLVIDAPDADITLRLQGHRFVCTEKSMGVALRVINCKSLTIDGASSVGVSTVQYLGGGIPTAIKLEAGEIELKDLTVLSSTDDQHINLSKFNAYGVYAANCALTMRDCQVKVDLSNQSSAATNASMSLKESPAGVFLADSVKSAKLVDCSVEAVNSPLLPRASTVDSTLGYAYALRSLCPMTVTISGGTFTASSALGDAVCISALKAKLAAGASASAVKLVVNAGCRACAVESLGEKGVTLNGPLKVSYGTAFAAQTECGLGSKVENAFVFGKGFSPSAKLGVMVGESAAKANAQGCVIGSFASAVESASRTKFAKKIVSASGVTASTAPVLKQGKIVFALNAGSAPASVVNAKGKATKYASLAEAAAAAQSGQTIKLLADCGEAELSLKAGAKAAFTLDLAGHSLSQLSVATDSRLAIVNSAAVGSVLGGLNAPALSVSGGGQVSVEGLTIEARAYSVELLAVEVGSSTSLLLKECSVIAQSSKDSVTALSASGTEASISLEDCEVSALTETPGVAAVGISSAVQTNSVEMRGTMLRVATAGGNAWGFNGKGSFVAGKSQRAASSIEVSTAAAAASATGVNMTSTTGAVSTCILEDCPVTLQCEADSSQSSYWCLTAGSGDPTDQVRWSIKGRCKLTSPNNTHITTYKTALAFDESTSFAGDVVVNAVALPGCVVARSTSTSQPIAAAAESLVAFSGSTYAGWGVAADANGSSIQFSTAASVENTRLGTRYLSLEDALDAAAEGDTLRLLEDSCVVGNVVVNKALTLDLSGCRLLVNAGPKALAGSNATGAAVVYSGTGMLLIEDSKRTGSLDITVGRDGEADSSLATAYQGLCVTGGGMLQLSSCRVNVSYAGSSTANPEISMRGIALARGQVRLSDASSLNVSCGSAGSNAFAPHHATGIYSNLTSSLPEGEAAISVEAGSSVSVANNAPVIERGSLHYADAVSPDTLVMNNGSLTQMHYDPSSERYQEILQLFREQARFDSPLETSTGGDSFGSMIYYAAPMKLSDGTLVWAYSAPVTGDDIGEKSAIVPALIFEQTTYELAPEATGIEASASFAGDVLIKGSVTASTAGGDAFAVNASGKGTWDLSGARLSASGAQGSYRSALGALDLREYFDLPGQSKAVMYPSLATGMQVVGQLAARACAAAKTGATNVVGAQAAESSVPLASGGQVNPVFNLAQRVELRFSNLRSTKGVILEDYSTSVDYGSALSEDDLPVQPDYVAPDGSTYRFVGWALNSTTVWDPQDFSRHLIDSSIPGVAEGLLELQACYVRVGAGQHLATFKVDGVVWAYALDDGETPSFASANAKTAKTLPTKQEAATGYTYTFKGWKAGWQENGIYSQGDGSTLTALPAAHSDVCYTASFLGTPSLQYVSFYYWKEGVQGYTYGSSGQLECAYGEDPTPLAQQLVPPGSVVVDGESTYTFLGWSVRKTDKEPVYTAQLPPMNLSKFGSSTAYYAIYGQLEQSYQVTFLDGSEELATVADLRPDTTIDAAFKAAGLAEPVSPLGWEFKGWAVAPGGSAERGAMVSISQAGIKGGSFDGSVRLYAVYENPYMPELNFYGADNSTILTTQVAYGQTLNEAGVSPKTPRLAGAYFVGWRTVTGTLLDMDAPIEDDLDLRAEFASLSFEADGAKGVSADLSAAYVMLPGLEEAEAVGLSVSAAVAPNSDVEERIAKEGNKVLTSYNLEFGYSLGGSTTPITTGFGTLKLQLPVKSGTAVKLYWLRANGTVGASATKVAENGCVMLSIADFGSSAGNVVVALALSTASAGANLSVKGGGAPALKPGSAAPVIKKGAAAAALKKDGAQAEEGDEPPLPGMEGMAFASTQDGVDADDAALADSGRANTAAFYAVVAGLVALLALLGRNLFVLFTGRRRDDEEAPEELEEQLDDERVMF